MADEVQDINFRCLYFYILCSTGKIVVSFSELVSQNFAVRFMQ